MSQGRARAPKSTSSEPRARAVPAPQPAPPPTAAEIDLDDPELYLNRELTWLQFNRRVLAEAEDERTPLLERVKFLSIASSNLDEFFMKRIGGLKQQVATGVHERTVDGRTPEEQIELCYADVGDLQRRMLVGADLILQELRKHEIRLLRYADLGDEEREELRAYYVENIYPLVTPQAMDPAHPFPFVSNLSLNLLVTLHHARDAEPVLARVKVPVGSGIPRFLRLASTQTFVALEDVIAHNLDLLFPGMEIDTVELFRVTRNADTVRDEDRADDLLALIESELRERRVAPIVRLEVADGMTGVHRGMLAAELGLDEVSEVFDVAGMLGLRDLMELATLEVPELHDPPHHPVDPPSLPSGRSVFHTIREAGAILLQHPYESFSNSVERFLREAAEDPKVRAIKMTLYRTSSETQVIDHLVDAALNGKQVAVAVELKARFDESANIRWAAQLEEAGIHVTYGVVGLKTHCKVILVLREDYNGLRRYAHLGTGNYNAQTGRLYSDLGLLTCDPEIGADLTELFNYLTTGFKPNRRYRKILPAPKILKPALLDKIRREIKLHREDQPGHIQMKVNALEDADITRALYEACQAGVRVDLIVRDTCRLRPGIPGLSETARVVSIVGRFLEHARIVYFANGNEPEYYIGSADLMKRNLESRVETLVPVERPALQQELRLLLDSQLDDTRSAWDMQSDGTYVQRKPAPGRPDAGSQTRMIERAEERHREAGRLRKRRTKGVARRSGA